MSDYISKIKDICDSLASIDVNVEEGEMVQICLGGLASKFGAFRTVRENMSLFFVLHSMLLIEENHAGASTSTHTDNKMLYTEGDRPRGRGGQGKSVRNGGGRQDQGRRHRSDADSNSGPSGNRGVEAMKTGKGNPPRNVGTVARKATGRASAGKSALIRREPDPDQDPDRPTKEIGNARTTPKDPEKPEKGLPS